MQPFRLAILSDIHYASAEERARGLFFLTNVQNPFRRMALLLYRRYYWLRDPFAHNHLLDKFMDEVKSPDLVVSLGDYSCDSGFIGLADAAAYESARQCVGKLREKYRERFLPIMGDHELGKKPLGANLGGVRLDAFRRARTDLGIEPFWKVQVGRYVLMGVTSTLVSWPVFTSEALESELAEWEKLRAEQMDCIRSAFAELEPRERVVLFCHDPTALPFLAREEAVAKKLKQVERTLIGHLHSNLFLMKSRILSGMPVIGFLGHSVKRFSTALREARYWKDFNLLLCPSLPGIELLKDGGYYTAELEPEGKTSARFEFHRLKRP